MVETGISEKIQFIDDTSTDITSEFGIYSSASFQISDPVNQEDGIGNEGKPYALTDGPLNFESSITCKPFSLKILQIMGDYTEDGGAGTWEITFPGQLPEHDELKGQIIGQDEDRYFSFTNFKVGGFSLEASTGDGAVLLTFEPILAKDGQIESGNVTQADPDETVPIQWKDYAVKFNGSSIGLVESTTQSMDRDIQNEHGLVDSTGADARKPQHISEGQFSIEPTVVVKVTDDEPFRQVLDDDSLPLQPQNTRTEISTVTLENTTDSTKGDIVLENVKANMESFDMDEDKNTRTVAMNLTARNIKVQGDL